MRDNLTRDNLKQEVDSWVSKMTDNYLRQEAEKRMEQLSRFTSLIIENHEVLGPIVQAEVTRAASAANDAGFGGRHDDGGAQQIMEKLKGFLQGVAYGSSHDTDNLGEYGKVYEKMKRENDPKYKEYLRLKEIYGDE